MGSVTSVDLDADEEGVDTNSVDSEDLLCGENELLTENNEEVDIEHIPGGMCCICKSNSKFKNTCRNYVQKLTV